MSDPLVLRTTFNGAAREYDAIRPGYPAQLIEDVVTYAGIPQNAQALEIGCGTGQATRPFAQRGYNILCLDIGADLLAIAAQNLSEYPNVRFKNIAFEQWSAQVGQYHLIYSATAFHWIPREIGYPKSALSLRPGGALAIFSNMHPRPFTDFFLEVQPIYKEHVPEWQEPQVGLLTEVEIQSQLEYIRSTGLFASVAAYTYPWTRTYTTTDYLRLLNTYSNHRSLEEGRRRSLYQSISGLIERRYGGFVVKPYLSVLYLAIKA